MLASAETVAADKLGTGAQTTAYNGSGTGTGSGSATGSLEDTANFSCK